jgi:hypothetical protein
MRKSKVSNFPWPKNPPEFRKIVSEIWELQEQMGRELIEYLSIGVGVRIVLHKHSFSLMNANLHNSSY